MIDPIERQRILDEEHLRLLRIVYLIQGWTYAVSSVFGLIYVGMGLMFTFAPTRMGRSSFDPRVFGLLFVMLGLVFMVGFAAFGGIQLYAARCLRLRHSRTLCLVAAVASCIMIPIGTALGIFTFIVLGRSTVQAMFDGAGDRTAMPPRAL
jgi:hypothetical protein